MIDIEYNDQSVLNALQRLQRAVDDLSPALKEIGEHLSESTKERFGNKTGPDGRPWEDNSPVTIAKKGRNWPLTGETGILGDTIDYQLQGNDTVAIGSPMEYAAMQQFGGTQQAFPWLFGDISARPFLGVSEDDKTAILDIISSYLGGA